MGETAPTPLALLRLASPSLPVGAFAYSRGLETAVQRGLVDGEETARRFILGALEDAFGTLDAPLFLRMMAALSAADAAAFSTADDWLAAGRESAEFSSEDRRMAEALVSLLSALNVPRPTQLRRDPATFPGAFALAAHHEGVAPRPALDALLWSVADAQVAATIRLGAVGQTGGQRILMAAQALIPVVTERAARLGDDEIGSVCQTLAMASAWHETLEGRLFRS